MDRQQFYKSRKWESFRRYIINQRTEPDGFVRCAICGKPILKPYDLIVHHTEELTDDNFQDATISLNPALVECVHFKCHNKIHDRFTEGHAPTYTAKEKKVFIVYGSPCSGKTSWVRDTATELDLVVDLDSIFEAIGVAPRYEKPGALRSAAFAVRDTLYDLVKYRSGKWRHAYIITGGALKGDRDRLKARVGADELIFISATMKECIERAAERGDKAREWMEYINQWFECFQPEPEPILYDDDTLPGA